MTDWPERAITLTEERNHSFCFTLTADGTQSRRSSQLEDFFPLIEQASIAWVDVKVEDFEKEILEAGLKFGYSDLMIKQLLTRLGDGTRFLGSYEDYNNQMGLLLPAINVRGADITIYPVIILLKRNLLMTIRSNQTHVFRNLHR